MHKSITANLAKSPLPLMATLFTLLSADGVSQNAKRAIQAQCLLWFKSQCLAFQPQPLLLTDIVRTDEHAKGSVEVVPKTGDKALALAEAEKISALAKEEQVERTQIEQDEIRQGDRMRKKEAKTAKFLETKAKKAMCSGRHLQKLQRELYALRCENPTEEPVAIVPRPASSKKAKMDAFVNDESMHRKELQALQREAFNEIKQKMADKNQALLKKAARRAQWLQEQENKKQYSLANLRRYQKEAYMLQQELLRDEAMLSEEALSMLPSASPIEQATSAVTEWLEDTGSLGMQPPKSPTAPFVAPAPAISPERALEAQVKSQCQAICNEYLEYARNKLNAAHSATNDLIKITLKDKNCRLLQEKYNFVQKLSDLAGDPNARLDDIKSELCQVKNQRLWMEHRNSFFSRVIAELWGRLKKALTRPVKEFFMTSEKNHHRGGFFQPAKSAQTVAALKRLMPTQG